MERISLLGVHELRMRLPHVLFWTEPGYLVRVPFVFVLRKRRKAMSLRTVIEFNIVSLRWDRTGDSSLLHLQSEC